MKNACREMVLFIQRSVWRLILRHQLVILEINPLELSSNFLLPGELKDWLIL